MVSEVEKMREKTIDEHDAWIMYQDLIYLEKWGRWGGGVVPFWVRQIQADHGDCSVTWVVGHAWELIAKYLVKERGWNVL